MSSGALGGTPPGTGFGDGERSGGIVGGVPGNGASAGGSPGAPGFGPGCSGDFGNWLNHIPRYTGANAGPPCRPIGFRHRSPSFPQSRAGDAFGGACDSWAARTQLANVRDSRGRRCHRCARLDTPLAAVAPVQTLSVQRTIAQEWSGNAQTIRRVVDHTAPDVGILEAIWTDPRSLGGKCADLNALFVGLCRAIGLPARDLYGIHVAQSSRFKSLGRAGDITSAQHCRAEVFIERIGWVPWILPTCERWSLKSGPVLRSTIRLPGALANSSLASGK